MKGVVSDAAGVEGEEVPDRLAVGFDTYRVEQDER
jgi:hypothetical protein